MQKKVIGAVTLGSLALIGGVVYKSVSRILHEKEKKVNKYKKYYNITNQWLYHKNQGKNLAEYFEEKGYNNIAIYGMGELGCRLYEELKDTNITISYAIDKEANSKYTEIKVIDADQAFDKVDAIVVTAVFDFETIKEKLESKTDSPIISLDDIFYDLAN